jgi:GNAT superfamily N-acetyltransferase
MYDGLSKYSKDQIDTMDQCHRRDLPPGRFPIKECVGWFAVNQEDSKVVGGSGVLMLPRGKSPTDPEGLRPHILNVFVDPGFRRKRIARALTNEAIGWCRDEGYSSVTLAASSQAEPLYESLGFQPCNYMKLDL